MFSCTWYYIHLLTGVKNKWIVPFTDETEPVCEITNITFGTVGYLTFIQINSTFFKNGAQFHTAAEAGNIFTIFSTLAKWSRIPVINLYM